MKRGLISVAAAAAVLVSGATYVALEPAHAEPGCTAAGLSTALASVANGTGAFLSSHPEAEAAVDTADEGQIRNYFIAHQDQWKQLQGIASPLRNLRQSCNRQVSSADVARLFDSMSA